jgi:hypothetical protein
MISALDGGEWLASRPGCFNPRESPGTYWIGGWVGLRAGLVLLLLLLAVAVSEVPNGGMRFSCTSHGKCPVHRKWGVTFLRIASRGPSLSDPFVNHKVLCSQENSMKLVATSPFISHSLWVVLISSLLVPSVSHLHLLASSLPLSNWILLNWALSLSLHFSVGRN